MITSTSLELRATEEELESWLDSVELDADEVDGEEETEDELDGSVVIELLEDDPAVLFEG
jgi:hypothetical protein